jgi:hypothetical protein
MTERPAASTNPRAPGLRLALTERFARANRLDGAWWPYSVDLTAELAPLLEAVSKRVGRVRGVLLNRVEWDPTPLDWTPPGSRQTRISWYGHQDPGVAILIGDNAKRVDLLVIAPDTDPAEAIAAMNLASKGGNLLSATDTIRAVNAT